MVHGPLEANFEGQWQNQPAVLWYFCSFSFSSGPLVDSERFQVDARSFAACLSQIIVCRLLLDLRSFSLIALSKYI